MWPWKGTGIMSMGFGDFEENYRYCLFLILFDIFLVFILGCYLLLSLILLFLLLRKQHKSVLFLKTNFFSFLFDILIFCSFLIFNFTFLCFKTYSLLSVILFVFFGILFFTGAVAMLSLLGMS